MTRFENLKNSYISAIQCGLAMGVGFNEAKHGNDVLHKFCEMTIDNSNYSDAHKSSMKNRSIGCSQLHSESMRMTYFPLFTCSIIRGCSIVICK